MGNLRHLGKQTMYVMSNDKYRRQWTFSASCNSSHRFIDYIIMILIKVFSITMITFYAISCPAARKHTGGHTQEAVF